MLFDRNTIAAENAAIEREIERLAQRQRHAQLAASPAAVPARFRTAELQARQEVQRAKMALDQAEQQVRARIDRERPSQELARIWFEQATLEAANAHQRAVEQLARAQLAVGRQVDAQTRLAALRRDYPARRAAIEAEYKAKLAQLDQELADAESAVER